MSLVHEALRKAEREKQRKLGATPAELIPARPATPQPIHSPVPHAPVAVAPVIPVVHEAIPQRTTPSVDESTETNHFLLPALIGCVAIVAIIAIVFLASNASSVWRQLRESPPITTAAPAPVAKSTAPVEAQLAAPRPTDAATAPSTPPPAPLVADTSKYNLSGIMKDPDGKYVAVLNGRVAYEGYYVDGATVKSIDARTVALDINGHEMLLRLF
jgi:hypothetical protein